jgi:hypothetical protein
VFINVSITLTTYFSAYVDQMDEKYIDDMKRCKWICTRLQTRFNEIFPGRKEGAHVIAELTGCAYSTAYQRIGTYFTGRATASFSDSLGNRQGVTLENLALFFHLLGIPEEEKVVELMKDVNAAFVYPLKPIEDIAEDLLLEAEELFDYMLHLDGEDMDHLEILTSWYAMRKSA